MVTQYIATRSLLDLCEWSERSMGGWVGVWWWDQVGINMSGAREAAAEEDGGEELRRGEKGIRPERSTIKD